MAYDLGRLNAYKYFREGGRLDQNLIENILLPGLSVQSNFAGGSPGIELPHGQNDPVEYLPLKDAAEAILDWFEQHNNLETDEARNLQNLIGKHSYRQLSDTLTLILHKRVQDPQKLLKSRLVQNVAELQRVKDLAATESASKSPYHPATDLIAYSRLHAEITRLANLGIPPTYINQLIPPAMTRASSWLTQQRLINILVSNPSLLKIASLHPGDRDQATVALTDKFREIVNNQHLDFAGINNFTGTDEFREGLYSLTARLNDQLKQNNVSLDNYEDLQIKVSYSLPHFLPSQAQLYDQIVALAPFSSQTDREQLARAILSTVASTSGKLLTADQILELASQQLNLPTSQLNSLHSALQSTGVLSAIEYQQNELHYNITARRLTVSERTLAQKGINPFHAHFEMSDLLKEASTILADPKIKESDAVAKMRLLYEHQLNSSNPSPIELHRLRGWLDRHHTVAYLDHLESTGNSYLKRLAGRSRTERWLTDLSDRLRAVETGFTNKWLKIEERLPWNVASRKFFEWYDKLAEARWAIVKIPLPKGKKLTIPVLKFFPWAFDQWDSFKRTTTIKAFRALSGKGKNWGSFDGVRKNLIFSLRQYSLGGYTVDGAVFRYGHKVWGKTLTWAIAKTGMTSVFKYSAKSSAGLAVSYTANATARIAVRFLIKIGGKTLAKFGLKAVTAILAAGSVIGSILSIAMVVGLVFDVLKLGYDLIKKFVQNVEFRKLVLKIGAGITAVVTFIRAVPIFAMLLAVGGMFVQGILVAFGWAFGLLAVALILWSTINTTIRLDSAPGRLITSLICDDNGEGGNPAINTAICIVQILTDCGLNPLLKGNANTPAWQCALASLVATDAMEVLKESATKYEAVQCVGFVRAVDVATGGPGVGWGNANTLGTLVPSGYTFASGVGSCAPGDIFVDTGGEVGHTGIFISNDGPYIKCADANGAGLGVVRGPDSCVWDSSKIAGCLKKN